MINVLIGLDIDGVLNPLLLDNHGEITKTPIHYLNRVLEICPNVGILITSCWGNHNNSTIDAMVKKGFKFPDRVVGNTDTMNELATSRTKEIELWLLEFDKDEKYTNIVCIDDDQAEFEYFGKFSGITKHGIVLCEGNTGFSINNAYELIVKLQGYDLRYWG